MADEPLDPDRTVTQYGRVTDELDTFKSEPPEGQSSLSLILGATDRKKAANLVCPWRKGTVREEDAVRYSTVGQLTDRGFVIKREPLPYFPQHLEVEFPGTWDDDVSAAFNSCFGEVVTGKVEDG